jgi:hypothetical protein
MAYELTPRRSAAARANLEKALATLRVRNPARAARPPNLRHGFFTRDLRRSVILLGEDVREYDAHVERFERVFLPQTDVERRIVLRLAEAAWRLLRGYRARANAQTRKLRKLLEAEAARASLDPNHTWNAAFRLQQLFCDERYLFDCVNRLRNHMERLFRVLLIERTGSDQEFRTFSRRRLSEWDLPAPFKVRGEEQGLGIKD